VLVGRVDESGALDRVLAGARDGVGSALVLRGPAGIGKTALLDWAVGRAADMCVTRVAGLESEV
jgi:predicted ATPase